MPFVLPAKILLQDLCSIGWDNKIPEEGLKRWENWLEELMTLEQFCIERCFKQPNFTISLILLKSTAVLCPPIAKFFFFPMPFQWRSSVLLHYRKISPIFSKACHNTTKGVSSSVLSSRLDRMVRQELDFCYP